MSDKFRKTAVRTVAIVLAALMVIGSGGVIISVLLH